MINEYVDCSELKRLFLDKMIKPEIIRYYYKKRGILLSSSNIDDMADQVYTLFLGTEDLQELQDLLNSDNTYIQSAVFQIKGQTVDSEGFLDSLIDDVLASMRWPSYSCRATRPNRIDEDTLRFSITYDKVNRGSNKLNAKEQREIGVNLRRIEGEKFLVDVRQTSSGDVSKVVKYFTDLSKMHNASVDDVETFKVLPINIEGLTVKSRVDFFDRIASTHSKEWTLKTITGITIKRASSKDDDEDEDDDDLGQEITEETATDDLAGINQAVLNGQALRSNGFVKASIEQNFYISSMKYRYEMAEDATEFVVSISCKKKNLHVDIVKSYRDDNGKMLICPYLREEQDAIIKSFQELGRVIYNELWKKQAGE